MKRIDLMRAVKAELKRRGFKFLNYQVDDAIDCVLKTIKGGINEDGEVIIQNFGRWKARQKRERMAYDMTHGRKAKVSARRVVTFYPGKHLKEVVNVPD